jgi:hypothetical protein
MAERIYDIVQIKKVISEKIKKEYPKYGFSITTSRGGSGHLYINWYKADFNPFLESGKTYLTINEYYINDTQVTEKAKSVLKRIKSICDEYNWNNSDPMTDYFDVNFYLSLYVGKYDKPFEVVSSSTKPSSSGSSNQSSSNPNWDKGTHLRTEAGWSAYVKMLPDGRIVYNAFKNKETASNNSDWDAIKGEVYIETGFKWSKYGFSKWGSLSPNDENLLLNKLFKVLSKYYTDSTSQEQTPPQQEDSNNNNESEVFVYGENFGVPANYGQQLAVILQSLGYIVIPSRNVLVMHKPNYPIMSIGDNGGEFNINTATEDSVIRLISIPYDKTTGIVPPFDLAEELDNLYYLEVYSPYTKEKVQDSITALQYLADAGNEDAISAITALKYLL